MALKNTYSKIPIDRIFSKLQEILAKHGAKKMVFDYEDDGRIHGLTFGIEVNGKLVGYKLPARINNVAKVLENEGSKYYDEEQVYRVAWRNILDWVDSQCAMIDIGMVKIEEVFLPYMADNKGKTLFEKFEGGDLLLGDGS